MIFKMEIIFMVFGYTSYRLRPIDIHGLARFINTLTLETANLRLRTGNKC